jgi:hypothetical protein
MPARSTTACSGSAAGPFVQSLRRTYLAAHFQCLHKGFHSLSLSIEVVPVRIALFNSSRDHSFVDRMRLKL